MNKTPDEIKRNLNIFFLHRSDSSFDLWYKGMHSIPDAMAYIQRLEISNTELLTKVKQLEAKCHQLKRERDAAVKDIHKACGTCKRASLDDMGLKVCPYDRDCNGIVFWQWRGVKED